MYMYSITYTYIYICIYIYMSAFKNTVANLLIGLFIVSPPIIARGNS